MDWKDILSKKIESGELTREEFAEPVSSTEEKDTGPLSVSTDRKGRKGKTAVIVEGFTASDAEVAQVAAWLKTRLGTGGSCRGGEILIQGDVADKVKVLLRERGYKVK